MESSGVLLWWAALIAASALNLVLWGREARSVVRDRLAVGPNVYALGFRQLVLSLVFTAGCAFRSVLPRAEASRICLHDVWFSSATITRSVATVAELCFAAQCALLLNQVARAVGSRTGVTVSFLVVPAIALAELFSWYSALTADYLGSVVEESIWASTAALIAMVLASMIPRAEGRQRRRLVGAFLIVGAYVAFMCSVDVPMYWSRWRAAELRGERYASLAEGWKDASTRSVVTRRWEDWSGEMPWMTLYFTVGVWVSIAFVRASQARHETITKSIAD